MDSPTPDAPTAIVPKPDLPPVGRPVVDSRLVTLAEDLEPELAAQEEWAVAFVQASHPSQILALAEELDPAAGLAVLDGHQAGAVCNLARLALARTLLRLATPTPALVTA